MKGTKYIEIYTHTRSHPTCGGREGLPTILRKAEALKTHHIRMYLDHDHLSPGKGAEVYHPLRHK